MKLFSSVVLAFVLFSCTSSSSKKSMLPGYSGSFGEVVIVVSNPNWNGEVGDALKEVYQGNQYGLPQAEPVFDVINVQKANFTSVFETFRNIVVVNLDPNWQGEAEYQLKKNEWARGQVVVKLTAASKKELIEMLKVNTSNLRDIFNNKELDRLIKRNNKFGNQEAVQQLKDSLGLTLVLQKDAELVEIDDHHAWIRLERERPKGGFMHQISQGVLIARYPYEDRSQFQDSVLLQQRDALLKKYIPGSVPKAYMTTEYEFYPPRIRELDYRGQYAKEIRGLWRMEVEFMGGPMFTLATLDPEGRNIIMASGYVFSPQFNKREFLREVEGMVKSIQFVEEE